MAEVRLPSEDSTDCVVSQTIRQSGVNLEAHLHFHHHEDRQVINQGHIGHLSTGDDNRRDTTVTSTNQELVNQLEKTTLDRITSWTAGMVKTAALHCLLSMIKSGSRWVTVRGSPGEGKTTLSYQALLELSTTGRRVFQVWKPKELSHVVSECPRSAVVMMDDMFGQLSFDLDNWKKWEVELQKILGETEHHSLQQSQTPQKDVVVIVVGRDYVFNSALCNLGKYSQFFTGAKHVINMTESYERDIQEKLSIWKTLSNAGGVQLDKKTVEEICNISCPHGFPHVCRLFVTMFKQDNNLKAKEFFKSPLLFLNQTVAKFMENDDVFEVFKELIVGDGKVSVRQLGQLAGGRKIIKAADNLVGSYLKKENMVFEFDQPSIFDSVAYHLSNSHLEVVIQKCPMSFLHERVRLKSSHGNPKPSNENSFVVSIPRSYSTDLVQRFVTEVLKRHFSKVLSHQAMADVEFVKEFISALGNPLQLMYEVDVDFDMFHDSICRNEGTFLYYIPSSKSPLLLEHIERHTKTQLSTRDIETVFAGACSFAATNVVTYLMRRHNIDINMQLGASRKTPLMIAALSGDSGFVDSILDMMPDISVKDYQGQTALHHLCYNGVVSAVSRVSDMGCDVNEKDMLSLSLLSWACIGNQTAVVRVLLDRGASVDSWAVYVACRSGNLDIVTLLFDRGASVDSSAVYIACRSGDLDIVTLLFDKEAIVDSEAVAAACRSGNLDIVTLLFDKGASVDSKAVAAACRMRNLDIVTLLFDKGASVDSEAVEAACLSGNLDIVTLLFDKGAIVDSEAVAAACRSGNLDIVTLLFDKEAIVDSEAVAAACRSGNLDIVTLLFDKGAIVDSKAVEEACRWGNLDIVTLLFDKGASVDSKAVAAACRMRNLDIVTLLFDKGASVDSEAVEAACLSGNLDIVTLLFDKGAIVDSEAVAAACRMGNLDIVTLLFDKGAIVDSKAVEEACRWGNLDIVTLLFDKGASVASKAVAAACVSGNLDIVTLLFDKGASVDSKAVAAACKSGNLDIVTLLFDRGASVDMVTIYGSPLHTCACTGRSIKVMKYLIEKGASVNEADLSSDTPLHTACKNRWHQGVQCLLEHGADSNSRDGSGRTPLYEAARIGSHECIVILIKAGADTRTKSDDGKTPLHSVVDKGGCFHRLPDITICQTLITEGVDVNGVDREGNTALHLLSQVQSDTEIGPFLYTQPASHFADKYRSFMRMLVENSADTQKLNKRGEPALRGWCRQLLYTEQN